VVGSILNADDPKVITGSGDCVVVGSTGTFTAGGLGTTEGVGADGLLIVGVVAIGAGGLLFWGGLGEAGGSALDVRAGGFAIGGEG